MMKCSLVFAGQMSCVATLVIRPPPPRTDELPLSSAFGVTTSSRWV